MFATTSIVHARKIPLLSIRKLLLEKHEKLGIIRQFNTSQEDSIMADIEVRRYLKILA